MQHRQRGFERRQRQRQNAAERRRVDRDRRNRQATACQDLGQQATERMADDRRLVVQLADEFGEVIGNLPDRLAGERFRNGRRLRRRSRDRPASPAPAPKWPAVENLRPAIPALGSSHRPCTKTIGGRPDALARSICAWSCCSSRLMRAIDSPNLVARGRRGRVSFVRSGDAAGRPTRGLRSPARLAKSQNQSSPGSKLRMTVWPERWHGWRRADWATSRNSRCAHTARSDAGETTNRL